jgi:phage-related minor tail protein
VANNIRGITIEIGGDTTKLGKALENSEKKSRSLQTELRAIQQSLKFNPDNVEMLAQKQTVLTQNIAETSDKLDTLKEAERQVIAQFERGEVAEEQVRALQREILKTENQLESMGTELSSTVKLMSDIADGTHDAERRTEEYAESLADAEKELEEFGAKAGEAFDKVKTGVLALGAGAIAGAGYALNLSTEFDKAFNTLQTQTGATAEEMDGLNEAMENVYKNNFGENIDDVAQSMATIKSTMGDWLDTNGLQVLTEDALLLRDTFDFEVNESIRAVNSLMNQFGIDGEQAYSLIAQGAQNGLNQNGDLLDVINEYAVQFADMGIEAEDMFNMLANGAEEGTWSVDKLGDAVKEFNIRASDGTITDAIMENAKAFGLSKTEATELGKAVESGSVESYQKLIEKLKEVDDDTQRYQLGVAMFGTMWEDLGENAVMSLFNTQGSIEQTTDALDKINDQKYDDIGSALQGLGRTLQVDLVDPLGEELKPVVEDVIEYVEENGPAIKETISKIVETVGNFIKTVIDNKDTIIATIVAIGAGMLAWNVVGIITSVVGAIKGFITIVKSGKTVMQALNLVMNANPIGILITAITALVAGFIYLWNNCEGFRNFWIGLWEKIKLAFQSFIDWIAPGIEAIKEFFVSLWTKISEVWASIMESLQPLFDSVIGAFREGWELIKVIWDLVSPYFTQIWENISAVFALAKAIFGLHFKNAWEAVKLVWSVAVSFFQTIWENIKLVFSVVKTFFAGMFSTAWTAIKEIWNTASGYFTAVWDTIAGIFSVVKSVLTGDFKGAWEGIKGIVNTWKAYFQGVWNSIKNVFGSVKSWFSSTFSSAWTAVKGVFSNWGSFFSGLWDKIKSTFSKIGTNISEAISGSVKSGINGVISSIEKTINRGIGLINGAIGLINKLPGVSVGKLGTLSLPRLYRGGVLKKGQVGLLEGDGAEAVVPLEQETGWINRIAQKMNELQNDNPGVSSVALVSKMDEMIQTMKTLKSTIVLDTGTLVGETINQIDEQLGNNYSMRERRI